MKKGKYVNLMMAAVSFATIAVLIFAQKSFQLEIPAGVSETVVVAVVSRDGNFGVEPGWVESGCTAAAAVDGAAAVGGMLSVAGAFLAV